MLNLRGWCRKGDSQSPAHPYRRGPGAYLAYAVPLAVFCMCGDGGTTDELDAHFLAVFTPADLIGHDGRKHEKPTT